MRQIIDISNPILHEVSEPIKVIDGYVREVAKDMERYILLPRCIGLSAPQLGEKIRLIGVKRNIRPPVDIIIIVNPVIIKLSPRTYRIPEGCMSIGGGKVPFMVVRHKIIKVKGTNLDGVEVTYKGHDLFAQTLKHEIDHLDGHLVSDRGIPLRLKKRA